MREERWKLIVNGNFLKQGSLEELINMEIFHVSGESYTKAIQYEETVHVWENSVEVQYVVG